MKLSKIFQGIGILMMVCLLCPTTSEGQILRDITRAAGNKFKRKVKDKAVNMLAEEIARRAFRPIGDMMDDWARENMKRDSAYAGMSDDSLQIILQRDYGKILANMNQAANLPDKYFFDYTMDVTITDEKDVHEMQWYISKDGSAIGFRQQDGKEEMIMVLDVANDIIAMYNLGDNTGQALPGMTSMGTMMARDQMDDQDIMYKVERRSGTKIVATYKCGEIFVDTEAYETEAWVSTETPFEWKDAYGTLFQRASPRSFNQAKDEFQGMMLESTTKEKGKRKGKYKSESKWETTKISEDGFTIDNSKYNFDQGMQ